MVRATIHILLWISLIIWLAGCGGPMQFAKDGGGQLDLQQDIYDCKEQWNRSGPGMAYARDPMGSLGYLAMYRADLQACMERKGWRRAN